MIIDQPTKSLRSSSSQQLYLFRDIAAHLDLVLSSRICNSLPLRTRKSQSLTSSQHSVFQLPYPTQSWSWVGSIHGLGWVGSEFFFNFWWVGLGWAETWLRDIFNVMKYSTVC